jgi:hypothetical protein
LKIPNGVIRSRNSSKDRQYNDQEKTHKKPNNNVRQNTTQKNNGQAASKNYKTEVSEVL